LKNRVASYSSVNPAIGQIKNSTSFLASNPSKLVDKSGLSLINHKLLNYKHLGSASGSPIVFVHGLGGTIDYWTPLIQAAQLDKFYSVHLFDLEGHGLSPTLPLSVLSVDSFAADLKDVFEHAKIQSGAILVAHSMGCVVAAQFTIANPTLVSKLILIGPPPSPLPEAEVDASYQRAETARTKGMSAVVDAVATASTSEMTKSSNPLALAAVRLSLLGQDPEGYAKGCSALARATSKLDFSQIKVQTLIITGSEDKISPPRLCESYGKVLLKSGGVEVLDNIGHWHVFEDVQGVAKAVSNFL
jgi:pimeloyl-ACP methyl ester carboxylesterase